MPRDHGAPQDGGGSFHAATPSTDLGETAAAHAAHAVALGAPGAPGARTLERDGIPACRARPRYVEPAAPDLHPHHRRTRAVMRCVSATRSAGRRPVSAASSGQPRRNRGSPPRMRAADGLALGRPRWLAASSARWCRSACSKRRAARVGARRHRRVSSPPPAARSLARRWIERSLGFQLVGGLNMGQICAPGSRPQLRRLQASADASNSAETSRRRRPVGGDTIDVMGH